MSMSVVLKHEKIKNSSIILRVSCLNEIKKVGKAYFRLDLESLELCESTDADLCLGAGGGLMAVGEAE